MKKITENAPRFLTFHTSCYLHTTRASYGKKILVSFTRANDTPFNIIRSQVFWYLDKNRSVYLWFASYRRRITKRHMA